MEKKHPLEAYMGLVEYLGVALGSQYEILLQDMENHVLLSVTNDYISVRVKGGNVTSMALELEQRGVWKHTDYLANIHCVAASGHNILASFYFIKEDDRLIGILSINLDTTLFSQSNSPILNHLSILSGTSAVEPRLGSEDSVAPSGMEETVDTVIGTYLRQHGTLASRLTYTERLALIKELKERSVFLVRGSVKYVAQKLECSSATIYRYLQTESKPDRSAI